MHNFTKTTGKAGLEIDGASVSNRCGEPQLEGILGKSHKIFRTAASIWYITVPGGVGILRMRAANGVIRPAGGAPGASGVDSSGGEGFSRHAA